MDDEQRYMRITLRIPKHLHERLTAAGDAASRSAGAEIVARLEKSFQPAPAPVRDDRGAEIAAVVRMTLDEVERRSKPARSR